MRFRIISLLATTAVFAFLPPVLTPAQAAAPGVRVHDRDGATRVVFDFAQVPSFQKKTIDDRTVELSFTAKDAPDLSALKKLNGLADMRVVSESGKDLRIWVSLTKPGTLQPFLAGNKVVIDIPRDPDFKAPPPEKAEEKTKENLSEKTPAKTLDKPAEKPPEKTPEKQAASAPEAHMPDMQAVPVEPVVQVAAEVQEAVAPKLPQPVTIELTTTEQIPVAVYVRDGKMNLVVDQPDFAMLPQVLGKPGTLPEPARIKLPQATGFVYTIPAHTDVRADGGGLNWRFVLTPSIDTKQKFIDPVRVSTPDGKTVVQVAFPGAKRVIEQVDTRRGQKLFVIPSTRAVEATGLLRRYPEFDVLASPVGMTVAAKVDDLRVSLAAGVVTIARPQGLAVSSAEEAKLFDDSLRTTNVQPAAKPLTEPPPKANDVQTVSTTDETRIFRFDRWEMGGLKALDDNARILLSGMVARNEDDRVQDYMTLAKLYVANGMGPEALGLLAMAADQLPVLGNNPEFLAIRGAARTLAGQYDTAFTDFSNPKLASYSEVKFWQAYALSNLSDWKQATERLPGSFDLLSQYPPLLRTPLLLGMAEIALRAGDLQRTEKALSALEKDRKALDTSFAGQLDYLQGEFARQKGEREKAKDIWLELADGDDDYLRARSGMALAALLIEAKEIDPKDAVDRLESLRFAWRGDELEASVNQKLGEMYLQSGDVLKGLNVLRTATTLLPGSEAARRITTSMADAFKNLYLGDAITKINPMDAVTIHEEFPELMPLGAEGDQVTDALIDRLVAVDLLPRAIKILDYQINHRLTGAKAADAALRLASLNLLDQKPKEGLETLQKVKTLLGGDAQALAARARDITLLHAKALSQMKEPEQAFEMLGELPQDFDVLSLKADIAWQTGRWTEASAALADIVFAENISPSRPPTDDQANMILNWAVSMNLAGDRAGLASVRERYGDLMKQSPLNDTFEVVTRPRQSSMLADRDTLNTMISEVDLFKDFLSAYKARPAQKPAEKPAQKPAQKQEEQKPAGQAEAEKAEPKTEADQAKPSTGQ